MNDLGFCNHFQNLGSGNRFRVEVSYLQPAAQQGADSGVLVTEDAVCLWRRPDAEGLGVVHSAEGIRQFNFTNVAGLEAILFVQRKGGIDKGVVGVPAGEAFKELLLIELFA